MPIPHRHRRRVLIDSLESRVLNAVYAGAVDGTQSFQTIDSLGASSIAWTHQPEQEQAGFYDGLVNDLGASGVRGAVMPNFELANDNNDPNVFNWAAFDKNQIAHVLQFDQRMSERGVKTMLLSVWTPPYWMKSNKSVLGGGTLRADMRAEFAEYLAAVVISAKRDFNVNISAISLQNEQFFPEPYESAMYDNVGFRETLVAVQQKFAREGLATKVLVNEDLSSPDTGRWKWFNQAILDDDEVDRSKLIIGAHYTDPNSMVQQAQQLAGTGVDLWYTEISGKSGDWSGGIRTARDVFDTFNRANASAFYYWTFNDPGSATPANQTFSLMQDGVPNGKYFALKHFYKYVRPGMQRLATSVDERSLRLSAFRDPKTGVSTIVMLNDAPSSNTLTLSLKGLVGTGSTQFRGFRSTETEKWASLGTLDLSGESITITLPALSMITLYNGSDIAPVTGNGSPPLPIIANVDTVSASALRKAVMLGNLAEVSRIVDSGGNANTFDPVTGWTALHAAAACNFPDAAAIVSKLIAAGANVNARDVDGFTPLHVAAMNQLVSYNTPDNGKATIAQALINAGASVDAVDNKGRTPLMWSALVSANTNYQTINTALPTMLLSLGADRTKKDAAGKTAYDYAVQEYKAPFVTLLAGTNLDTQSPGARYAKYSRDLNRVSIVIPENVTATLEAGDVQVVNRATGVTVPISSFFENFSSGLTIARANFASRLPDGHYRLSIAAGAFTDVAGKASQMVSVDFDVLAADANGDNTVNFADLVILSQNYNLTGRTWSTGDFTGDGKVDFFDLTMLAQQYNKSLSPLAASSVVGSVTVVPPAAPKTPTTKTKK